MQIILQTLQLLPGEDKGELAYQPHVTKLSATPEPRILVDFLALTREEYACFPGG